MDNLLKSRRFFPLLITQFLGALNDNLFKNALLTLVVLKMTSQSDVYSNIIAGLFILPFFLFSAWAGELADKIARDKIARALKILEICLMLGVGVSYFLKSIPLLIIFIGLMGVQSAFFGPVKYALLPQQLKENELITGNAYIEASTYLAILSGLILGTLLPITVSICLLITLSVLGYFSSKMILPAPAPRPDLKITINLFEALYNNYRFLKRHKYIFQSILGASWFWIIGAFAAVQIYPLCGKVLSAGNGTITFFLVLFSFGVAVGSYVCNLISKGIINMIYVPLSALGMALCLITLWGLSSDYPAPDHLMSFKEFLLAPHALGLSFCLFMLAFFGGLYVIVLNAFMQNRAPKAYTATVIAGNNIFNALGMASVAFLSILFLKLGFSIPQLFLIMGLAGLVVAFYICSLLPDYLLRSVLQTILRFMFRTKVSGLQNYYKAGKKVLIISNHASLWDGVLLAAFMPERITFAITSEWTGKWFMPVIRLLADFYPIDPRNPLSIRTLIEKISQGKKVMIFPEGRITLTGKIMQVYDGAAMIAAKSGAKILPVRINGAQFSTMSYVKDKFHCRLFPKIDLSILEAQKLDADLLKQGRAKAQSTLYRLMIDMITETSQTYNNIFEALQNTKKIIGSKKVIARNLSGETLNISQLIRRGFLLAHSLKSDLKNKQKVGVLVDDPLLFLTVLVALDYLNKTIVVFDSSSFESESKVFGADVIISQNEPQNLDCPCLNLSKIRLNYAALLYKKSAPKSTSKIVFFKNSKSLEYSMRDLLENCVKLDAVLPFNTRDRAINCLKLSNGDNFVLGVLLPILSGVDCLFCNGLHLKLISYLTYDLAATLLFGAKDVFDTVFKNASAFDFFSMRMAFSVGDKIENEAMLQWLKQYNVRILESYTPSDSILTMAINTPLYNRFGSLGQPLDHTNIKDQGIDFDQDGFVFYK